MGPGYFPLVLAGVAGRCSGSPIAAKGSRRRSADERRSGPIPWRAIVLILAALVLLRRDDPRPRPGAGALRHRASSPRSPAAATARSRRALMAAGLTLVCVLIFVVGLGVPVPLLGPWLRP